MIEAKLLEVRKKLEAKDLSLLNELSAVLQKNGIDAYIHSFTISTESIDDRKVRIHAENMKCGFCCWNAGPSTMGCGICCDF